MVSEKNLIPFNERTEGEQREIARKGGIASGKARREKQKTQQILVDLVSIKNKDLDKFRKLALKLGLDGDVSIHEVFTVSCLLNSVKSGNLGDLERLAKLLGENDYKDEKISKVEQLLTELTPNDENTMD